MVTAEDIKPAGPSEWLIPQSYRAGMRVGVHLFASRRLLEASLQDLSLEQAVNAAMLPGVQKEIVVMPDVHQGYGFPIGGVAATAWPDGVISPGGIGYDINCGVRLLVSQVPAGAVRPVARQLARKLYTYCPSGVGIKSPLRLSVKDLEQICSEGARWALDRGMATEEDLVCTEEGGVLAGADCAQVSRHAMERGLAQMGTLGAGNHFLEVDEIDALYDEKAAYAMGLSLGAVALQIHCGSRGFGHQICTDYVQLFQSVVSRYGIKIPDRELVCAPLSSPEGKQYLAAMRAAANFAFCNRQVLAFQARRAFAEALGEKAGAPVLRQVYDVAHNIAKIETHEIEGKATRVCVHRKGATRAFGPGTSELPVQYQEIGQPVLVPGSMGTGSWVLVGTSESMAKSFGSSCHGAGRRLSRARARRGEPSESLRQALEQEGIVVQVRSLSDLAEEAPQAYKDVDEVVDTVASVGLAAKVAHLKPIAVIKG